MCSLIIVNFSCRLTLVNFLWAFLIHSCLKKKKKKNPLTISRKRIFNFSWTVPRVCIYLSLDIFLPVNAFPGVTSQWARGDHHPSRPLVAAVSTSQLQAGVRGGNEAEFADMVKRCNAAGVRCVTQFLLRLQFLFSFINSSLPVLTAFSHVMILY